MKLDVFFYDDEARPHPAEQLSFGDERAIGFQKHHENIEGARAELDRNPAGKQLPLTQQHAETAEFENLARGGFPA
jgi:hypothetical protein